MAALVDADPGRLRDVKPHELGIRFAFGALISIVAGVVGHVFGARVGGLFLAFPAILPATATLIEQKHGNRAAKHDVMGAAAGAAGLIAFAVVGAHGLDRWPPGVALGAAALAWAVVSITCYVGYQLVRPGDDEGDDAEDEDLGSSSAASR